MQTQYNAVISRNLVARVLGNNISEQELWAQVLERMIDLETACVDKQPLRSLGQKRRHLHTGIRYLAELLAENWTADVTVEYTIHRTFVVTVRPLTTHTQVSFTLTVTPHYTTNNPPVSLVLLTWDHLQIPEMPVRGMLKRLGWFTPAHGVTLTAQGFNFVVRAGELLAQMSLDDAGSQKLGGDLLVDLYVRNREGRPIE